MNYEALLESLADGVEVDWAAVDAQAATEQERRRYRNLRLVARVAELHRTIVGDEDAPDQDLAPLMPAATGPGGTAAAPAQALIAWGHLDVRHRIAGGAFGDVYLARDPQLDRDVALKLLRPVASWRRPLDRLLAEARTLARVRHPNVVAVHGADVREGRAGLWMEFVHGQTLDAWLNAHGSMGPGEAIAAGADICRALAAVHAAGLVHGDVKAQNIMREDGGRIVLMDFGAGRAQAAAVAVAAGTPLYLAPEVLAGEPATPRSDLYSLGVLLFHLLTRSYPYQADDLDGLRAAHADGSRTLLRDLRPDLPGRLVAAIERALDPDPARRYATAGEMERALADAGHTPSAPALPQGIVLGLALLALVAVAVAAVLYPRVRSAPPAARESISVLPFSGAGAEFSPLMDGLTNDLLRELQRYDIVVKEAAGAPADESPATLQARLGVGGLVRGDVRKAGTRTDVHVAVIQAGVELPWSQTYGVDDGGLPALARTIARDVAHAIGARPRDGAPAVRPPASYPAYEAYQQGRAKFEERSPASLARSLEFFKQAAALDPTYAEPWAGMADAYIELGVPAFGVLSPIEARRLAKTAALHAIELDPNLVEAQTSLAFQSYFHDWNWADAEVRFKRAIALNPQYALAHHWYADYLTAMGRPEQATIEIHRALELAPLSISTHRDVAWHLFFQRRYDEAIAHLQQTVLMDPDFGAARTLLARALSERGRYAEALEQMELARPFAAPKSYLAFKAYIQAQSGDRAAAERTLREVTRRDGWVPPYYVALVHVALGNTDRAVAEFERAADEQDTTIVNLKTDPRLDRIRSHPGFQALLARLAFPDR